MVEKDEVIVLTFVQHKDKTFIVKGLTKQHGLKTFLVNINPKKKSTLAFLQPFGVFEIEYSINKKSDLLRLKDFKSVRPFYDLRTNIFKSSIAVFLAETVSNCLISDECDEPLFEFVQDQIVELENSTEFKNFHILFLLNLTKYFGIYPSVNEHFNQFDLSTGIFSNVNISQQYSINKEDSIILARFLQQIPVEIPLKGKDRIRLLQHLCDYYQYHIDGFKVPKSLGVLKEVFS